MRVKEVKNGAYLWNVFARDVLSKKHKSRLINPKEIVAEYFLLELFAKGKTAKEAKEEVKRLTGIEVEKTNFRAIKKSRINLREPKNGIPIGEIINNLPSIVKSKKISKELAEELRKAFRKRKKLPKRLQRLALKILLGEERRKWHFGKNRRLKNTATFLQEYARKKMGKEIPFEFAYKEVYRLRKKSYKVYREELRKFNDIFDNRWIYKLFF